MTAELWQAGLGLGAIALILYTGFTFMTGAAYANGASVRELIRPGLTSIRERSPLGRDELADVTLLIGAAFATVAAFVQLSFFPLLLGAIYVVIRPQVAKMMSVDHPMMAIGRDVSGDLVIGLSFPLALANLMTGDIFMGLAVVCLMLSVAWPAGTRGGRRSEQWRPAWVNG